MKKVTAVVLSIIICIVLLYATDRIGKINNRQAHRVEEPRDHRDKKEKELCKKIQTEIEFLFDHDWAGAYFLGDGLSNISFLAAPESGYVFINSADIGLRAEFYGAVSESNGRINLSVKDRKYFENSMKMYQGVSEELIPVTWGLRRYLIPADKIIDFCNAVNEGDEPRTSVFGNFLLRRGDEKLQVRGLPDIPEEFRNYLQEKPVNAEIIAVKK